MALYFAGRTLEPGADYLAVFRFTGATALIGYALAGINHANSGEKNDHKDSDKAQSPQSFLYYFSATQRIFNVFKNGHSEIWRLD